MTQTDAIETVKKRRLDLESVDEAVSELPRRKRTVTAKHSAPASGRFTFDPHA